VSTDQRAASESAFKGVHFSLVDQALLSITNFAIGLVFIRYASKTDYYAYSQLLGYIALTIAIQAALINTTALTLLPQKVGEVRRQMANAYLGLQWILSLLIALAGGLTLWLVPELVAMETMALEICAALSVMVVAVWLREFLRNIQFIRLRPDLCLWQDILYVLMVGGGIWILLVRHEISASSVLLIMAAAGLVSALVWMRSAELSLTGAWQGQSALLREIWPYAKWSLPAGLVAWAFGNGYLLIGAQVIGPEVTAEIVAAKLFIAPLGMIFVSWANIFRPRVSAKLAVGDVPAVRSLTAISMFAALVLVVIYAAALMLAYPTLEDRLLGEKYQGLSGDIVWWSFFFLASGLSGICNGVLLAGGRFRHSFYAAAISSVISIPLMYLLGVWYGKDGLMLGLVLGEATYASVLFVGMRHLLKQVVNSPKEGH